MTMTQPQGDALPQDAVERWRYFCTAVKQRPDFRRQVVENYQQAFNEFGITPTKTALNAFLGDPGSASIDAWTGWVALRSILTILAPVFDALPPTAPDTDQPTQATDTPTEAAARQHVGEDFIPLLAVLAGTQTLLQNDQSLRTTIASAPDPIAALFGPTIRNNLLVEIVQEFLGSPSPSWTPAEYQHWFAQQSVITMLSPTIPTLPDAPISPNGICDSHT